ncbi:uncharacterized protein VTP21DRAFT_541 [Calcarisporiella thermophila]|uniref:uncharacterized protein n=1 Tax=Calcarisporiella thermophila TaxID=911321 RepID=UPI0037427879
MGTYFYFDIPSPTLTIQEMATSNPNPEFGYPATSLPASTAAAEFAEMNLGYIGFPPASKGESECGARALYEAPYYPSVSWSSCIPLNNPSATPLWPPLTFPPELSLVSPPHVPAPAPPAGPLAPRIGGRKRMQTVANDQPRPYVCDKCPQSFTRNHDLKRHKRIHLQVKPFSCQCGKAFSRRDALKRHMTVRKCVANNSVKK